MTIFKLIKIALDELYAETEAAHGDETDAKIKECIAYLRKSYRRLSNEDRPPVDYKDPATRFAYVYKYVAAHGSYIVQVLSELRGALGQIFSESTVRVSCIGGGPGSDIIAVIKYLANAGKKEPVTKIICYLLDKEQAWADTWTELDESLKATVQLNANFQPLDVTTPESWQAQKKFLQADLFTMSYFVSEVASLDNEGVVTHFWTQLFDHAKPGSLFLYIDNGSKKFNDYFDDLTNRDDLELVIYGSDETFTPSSSEQASELDWYIKKFDHSPKIQGKISYRVHRKK